MEVVRRLGLAQHWIGEACLPAMRGGWWQHQRRHGCRPHPPQGSTHRCCCTTTTTAITTTSATTTTTTTTTATATGRGGHLWQPRELAPPPCLCCHPPPVPHHAGPYGTQGENGCKGCHPRCAQGGGCCLLRRNPRSSSIPRGGAWGGHLHTRAPQEQPLLHCSKGEACSGGNCGEKGRKGRTALHAAAFY